METEEMKQERIAKNKARNLKCKDCDKNPKQNGSSRCKECSDNYKQSTN